MNYNKILSLLLIISLIITMFLVLKVHRMTKESIDDKVRTEVIHSIDTIKVSKPTPTDTITLTKTLTKAIYVPSERLICKDGIVDTLRTIDTLRMDLPMTQKVYRDTNYVAYVSGVEPQLDSIKILRDVLKVTTVKNKKKRWSVGPSIGAGYGIINRKPDIYAGFTVSYNLLK